MAKIVLAGRSDCPYFARCERLGDRLAKSLEKFKLHKIVIQPDEWEDWLSDTCEERGWTFNKSPIIWRELIDRGGKGVLIGSANDFQEYAKAYYDVEVEMDSSDMEIISNENKVTKDIIDEEERIYKARSCPIHVCITNGASPESYYLLNALTSGHIFGPNTEVTFRLLVPSINEVDKAISYAMEAEDLARGNVRSVNIYTNPNEAFQDCSAIILLESLPRLSAESQADWLERNSEFITEYADIINERALKSCKIMICGKGPMNYNALTMIKNTPNIARQNIVAVPTMVENQAKSVIGERLGVNPADVANLIVWGNIKEHNTLDLNSCRVYRYKSAVQGPSWYSVSTMEAIHNKKMVEVELPKLVASRQRKVQEAIGYPSSLSIAAAISTTLRYWINGAPDDQIFSLAVYSEGWYGVPEGLVFSFPVRLSSKGSWNVVPEIPITKSIRLHIQSAVKDLKFQISLCKDEVESIDSAATTKVQAAIKSLTSEPDKESLPSVG